MKRIYFFLLCICLSSLPLIADDMSDARDKADFWEQGRQMNDSLYYKILGGDSVALVSAGTDLDSLEIPAYATSTGTVYRVTAIADSAFSNVGYLRTRLTKITLPKTINTIGAYAFAGFRALRVLSIPDQLTSMGDRAFHACASLDNIVIPGSLVTIPNYAFNQCTALKNITLSEGIRMIMQSAFTQCTSLKQITLPQSLTTISHYAFSSCSSLKTIVIPDKVSDIYIGAFTGCINLTQVQLSAGLTNLWAEAFKGCPLQSLYLPEKLTYINHDVFMCDNLSAVYCAAATIPGLKDSTAFYFSDASGETMVDTLYVPYRLVGAYKTSMWEKRFKNIVGYMYSESDVSNITSNSASIMWQPDPAVAQYKIDVYQNTTHIAHYEVDGNGHVISEPSGLPSIYHQKMDTTTSSTDYFVISLGGLSAGTDYDYTIQGINASNEVVYHEQGSFTTRTDDEQGIDEVLSDQVPSTKVLRDGMLYIIRPDGKTYTLQGTRIDD